MANRGYGGGGLRENLRARGIHPCIPERPGKRPNPRLRGCALRGGVEPTFAWLGNFRPFLVRQEYYAQVLEAFVLLICR